MSGAGRPAGDAFVSHAPQDAGWARRLADRQRAWTDVGGHPRTLEYLDALLRGGEARFHDVRDRLEDLLDRRGIPDPEAWLRSAGTAGLDAALAEAVTWTGRLRRRTGYASGAHLGAWSWDVDTVIGRLDQSGG
ncbi:hypothetical protein [Planomonospora sp. ID82291]|uniref:hypothetical protein n=1 Tax=Planomonospora sp. ID82291 TaxID=2738136 RepID=UPI0018C3DE7F|nr:hypothetical protein [Planomonospora sp. ID82291]MBG0816173.1 hypothetical protein [Planomonospora sp. ID82291]